MSIAAVSYALKLDLPRSSEKFLMVCMGNYADEFGYCYPSITTLERDTSQDRKTIINNLKRLQVIGLLEDTGRRVGATGSIPVYRILGLPAGATVHYVFRVSDPDTGEFYLGKRSFNGAPELDTYRGSGRWPLAQLAAGRMLVREVLETFETPEEASAAEVRLFRACVDDRLCRNDRAGARGQAKGASRAKNGTGAENGAVPFFPDSSSVFPGSSAVFPPKQSQKRDIEPLRNTPEEKKGDPSGLQTPAKPGSAAGQGAPAGGQAGGGEPPTPAVKPGLVCTLPLVGNKVHEVMKADVALWADAYPAVDIKQALKQIKAWLVANPTMQKTKRGINRHITAWLANEQNKGGGSAPRVPRPQSYGAPRGAHHFTVPGDAHASAPPVQRV